MSKMRGGLRGFCMLLLGVLIGFALACILVILSFLELNTTMTVGNVLQASATIFVGLVIAVFINRDVQAERKDKDLLLGMLEAVIDSIRDLNSRQEVAVLTEVIRALKHLSTSCKDFVDMATFMECTEAVTSSSAITNCVRRIRKLSTSTPVREIEDHANTAEISTKVKEGIITLANERKLELANAMRELRMLIYQTQVAINRM